MAKVAKPGSRKGRLPPTARSLPIVLIRARENVMAPIRKMLADSGITEQQWRVLRVLAEAGPMDSSKVAERASLLLPSLTRIALTMREKGLITQVQDPVDRRRQKLAIAPAGRELIDRNIEQALEIVAGFKAKLGEADYERLLDLLDRLA
ncbi:MAG: MarR family transcriptional regulator [Nitratireductor sp.]|nr:MarR family transcriptional regulator [Nitratireductor sp.]